MDQGGSSAAKRRSRAWVPWALLAGMTVVLGLGALSASRSISALLERNAQLEREALESEARVAELQGLRSSMERRLRLLEQQQHTAQPPAHPARGADALAPAAASAHPRAGRHPPPAPAKAAPRSKGAKKAGRR